MMSEREKMLSSYIVKWTGCTIQGGFDAKGKLQDCGWPCGTCTCDLFGRLGVHENKRHNEPVDKVNEAWRAILQIRGEEDA
jgi:hypothetical protein